jgi:hypothetical protein
LFFASKSKNELSERILRERQAYIHKAHVGITVFIGVFHNIPYHYNIGMQKTVGFASEGRIPEIGISHAIDTSGTCNYLSPIFCHEEPPMFSLHYFSEKGIIGYIAFRF